MYSNFFKRFLDFILSLLAILALTPIWLLLIVLIYVSDPGPVFFTQKRVGKNKKYFKIVKFRTMKLSTPKDMPTHLLENPDQYITKIGKVLRKTSLDELPQLFNILVGQMAVIGPRPALWNQEDLIAERDKYGANDIRPGLTGLAQIKGRDELLIEDKAALDGKYTEELNSGRGVKMDLYCFFGTIKSVIKHEGVVEGGTGEIEKKNQEEKSEEQTISK